MDCTGTHWIDHPSSRLKHVRRTLLSAVGAMAIVTGATAAASPLQNEPHEPLPDQQAEALTPLPRNKLFDRLIADPREAVFSLRYLQGYAVEDAEFDAAAVSLGEYFGLFRGEGEFGLWQLGIEAAAFALFNLDSPSLNLVNTDYRIGLPLTARSGDWSYRASLYHQSSHLGDEFLLQNPDIERENISFEAAEALVSYHWRGLRPYAGAGYILSSDQNLDPGMLQYGVEYRHPDLVGPFDLLAGVNVNREEELDWEASRSYRVGLDYALDGRSVALMLEYFDGFSPTGQFFAMPVEYTGIGLYFRL